MEETRSLAPVILFTYNRPEHTKRTIEALAANELAAETDLYVFSDAAKKDADKGKVQEIRDYVKSVQGFRQVELTAREQNYGLAKNVIEGVTAIVNKYGKGILICLLIAIPSWIIGKMFPVIGGAVIAILAGMIIAMFWNDKQKAEAGIKWTSKIVLQTAVVLLGFGMNLGVIFETGKQSLPIILCTITTSLVLAWVMKKILKTRCGFSTGPL